LISLSSCTSVEVSNQAQLEEMVDELSRIADDGLACLESHLVADPNVTYDVVETDSLITPILGVIAVETRDTIATMPDGTPIATFLIKFELTFTYEEGNWQRKDLEVIQGRDVDDTDPVNVCFP
jgi:hypothetical protein